MLHRWMIGMAIYLFGIVIVQQSSCLSRSGSIFYKHLHLTWAALTTWSENCIDKADLIQASQLHIATILRFISSTSSFKRHHILHLFPATYSSHPHLSACQTSLITPQSTHTPCFLYSRSSYGSAWDLWLHKTSLRCLSAQMKHVATAPMHWRRNGTGYPACVVCETDTVLGGKESEYPPMKGNSRTIYYDIGMLRPTSVHKRIPGNWPIVANTGEDQTCRVMYVIPHRMKYHANANIPILVFAALPIQMVSSCVQFSCAKAHASPIDLNCGVPIYSGRGDTCFEGATKSTFSKYSCRVYT
jgi:hypothetical protein